MTPWEPIPLGPNTFALSEELLREVKRLHIPWFAEYAFEREEGEYLPFSGPVNEVITTLLVSLIRDGRVTVGPLPEEVTPNQAAAMLGTSRTSLKRMLESGKLEYFKVGTHSRLLTDDVMRLAYRRDQAHRF